MEFRILGPLQLRGHDHDMHPGGQRSQRLLAALLLSPNQVVTVARLIEVAWDEAPPATARRQVQNRVAALRSLLIRAGAIIETHDAGYRLRVTPDELDLLQFEELVARAAAQPEDPRRAAECLRAALGLWRGPALAGLGGTVLEQEAAVLDERRLAALADCLDLELAAGEDAQLIPELCQLVAQHPMRERLVGQWMVALCRTGRQGEALAAYQELRRRLVDALGVEPGAELQELHRAVLKGTLTTAAATAGGPAVRLPVPRQLPSGFASFTGREDELAELEAVLSGARRHGPAAMAAIQGPGGIGKSALAIHAAHRMAGRYADGQLYVDLQGATAGLEPLPAIEVLGRFLRALGVDSGDIPTDVGEAAARFRSELASRRLLVVLDNARDAAQVAPLLPGASDSAVVVTSRRLLTNLDGVHHLHLSVLSEAEAVTQLARVAGPDRVAAEPAAAAEAARWCGYLPLALRIAGSRLAARPGWPLRALVERLADAQRRLDELELGDVSVRSSVAVSHEELRTSADPVDRAAAAAFVALSLLDGPDVSLPVAARLIDQAELDTERVLERLVDASLLESPTPGRYRLPDLLRLYAHEQFTHEWGGAERAAAVTRAVGTYPAPAWQTFGLLRLGDNRPEHAGSAWRTAG